MLIKYTNFRIDCSAPFRLHRKLSHQQDMSCAHVTSVERKKERAPQNFILVKTFAVNVVSLQRTCEVEVSYCGKVSYSLVILSNMGENGAFDLQFSYICICTGL